jgi:hypothetical protein
MTTWKCKTCGNTEKTLESITSNRCQCGQWMEHGEAEGKSDTFDMPKTAFQTLTNRKKGI